ncbi:MAG TPA: hypothetical protein VN317_09480 [Candidatus Methanoperedens sp.]|nr:hypothetical protein [Candidatus Methanoperedens sp.]
MDVRTMSAGGADWLGRLVAAALLAAAASALILAGRLGLASGAAGDDLLAELRARTERRVAAERAQIGPALEAAVRGGDAAARREAEGVLARRGANSQLHLLLAGAYRREGETAPALREYRRAVELVRDYTDRRSPRYIGAGLGTWLRDVRPSLSGPALTDLHYLERALAGGCS